MAPPATRFEMGDNVALWHDLVADPTLPQEFDSCDVLYAEPPWPAGFDRFNRRAGTMDGRTYADLLTALTRLIEDRQEPVILILGRQAQRQLPEAQQVIRMTMNGGAVLALLHRVELDPPPATNLALLAALARLYSRVGDPMCGYGLTARVFTAAGKAWTLSDSNRMCIGHIARTAPTWKGAAA